MGFEFHVKSKCYSVLLILGKKNYNVMIGLNSP